MYAQVIEHASWCRSTGRECSSRACRKMQYYLDHFDNCPVSSFVQGGSRAISLFHSLVPFTWLRDLSFFASSSKKCSLETIAREENAIKYTKSSHIMLNSVRRKYVPSLIVIGLKWLSEKNRERSRQCMQRNIKKVDLQYVS